jgi:hypothetical protein
MLAPEMEADGVCQNCRSSPGTLMMDPYREDVHGQNVPVILCPDCYREACAEI